MKRLRVVFGNLARPVDDSGEALSTLHHAPGLLVQGSADVTQLRLADGRQAFLSGDIVGLRTAGDALASVGAASAVSEALQTDSFARALELLEGRFILVVVELDGAAHIGADHFGQRDVFYQSAAEVTVFASDLSLLPEPPAARGYDQVGVAHALAMYGYRPAKQHTFYQGVRRLGVGETARLQDGRVTCTTAPFHPAHTGPYTERDLHRYADLFLDAVRARGSRFGNVVYLSSGWDSTAILAALVHVFGARRVRAVIGRMQYASRSGVINQFELDRAQAMAGYFGVPLEVAEFDYRTAGPAWLDKVRPYFKPHHFASMTGINHAILAEKAASTSTDDEVVFAGEISDGAHNLGFSQFATILEHPVLEFREYSDKMASYLFGPTALRLMGQGKLVTDPVYQLLRSRAGTAAFDAPAREQPALNLQLLSSFFLSAGRLPLYSLQNSRFFSAAGRETYARAMQTAYLQSPAEALMPETLYAWYLHLYNSFHWQGSTVATLPLTAEAYGLRAALPFWDSRLQEFLSAMPENFGRGLDLNPTKYPLKWALKNRIDYPYHLQTGPHSYQYDVDPAFSHSAELMYGSSFKPYFQELFRRAEYLALLSPDMFDLAYVEGLVQRYRAGNEVRGGELTDLTALALIAMIGWY